MNKKKGILTAITSGEKPSSFSGYSLPKDYKTTSFDYDFLVVRTKQYMCTKNVWKKIFEKLNKTQYQWYSKNYYCNITRYYGKIKLYCELFSGGIYGAV